MSVSGRHEDERGETADRRQVASGRQRRFGWAAIGGGILSLLLVLAIVVLHHVHAQRQERLASVVSELSAPVVTPVTLPPGWDGPRPSGVVDELWKPAVDAAPTAAVERSADICDSAMRGPAPACLVAAVCTARLARVADSHRTTWRARSENQWLIACEEILPECAEEAEADQRQSASEALVRLSLGALPVAPAVVFQRDSLQSLASAQSLSPPWSWDFFRGGEAESLRVLEGRLDRWRSLRDLPGMEALRRSEGAIDEELAGSPRAVRRGLQLCALGIANAGRADFDGGVLQGLEAERLRLYDRPADIELILEPWADEGAPTDADRRLATGLAEVFAEHERALRGCWSHTNPGQAQEAVMAHVRLDAEATILDFRFDERELTLPSDRLCWAHALVGRRVPEGTGTAGEHTFRIRAGTTP